MEPAEFFKTIEVQGQTKLEGKNFPLTLGPSSHCSFVMLQSHFINNSTPVLQQLQAASAVLYRGFDVKSPNECASILNKLPVKPFSCGHHEAEHVVGKSNSNNICFSEFLCAESTQTVEVCKNQAAYLCLFCQSPPLNGEKIEIVSKEGVTAVIQWQHGDILLLDNSKVSLKRSAYEGPFRKMYISYFQESKENPNKNLGLVLNSGDQMPLIGYGTWKIARDECVNSVYLAIKNGYRQFDGASIYDNEKECGLAVKKAIEDKIVERKDLFITSKLWNTYHRPDTVKLACKKSLEDWGLDYFDLYLMHFPISIKYVPIEERYFPFWITDPENKIEPVQEERTPLSATWKAMEELVTEGLVRNIGVSNFKTPLLRDLINSSSIPPAVLQNEIHPYLTDKKLIRFCRENRIQLTSYSTLGAASYIELGITKEEQSIANCEAVCAIAKKHGRSSMQVVLRWALQQGLVVIPKSTKEERMRENFATLEFELREEEMKEIDQLNKNIRFNDTSEYENLFMEGKFIPTFG